MNNKIIELIQEVKQQKLMEIGLLNDIIKTDEKNYQKLVDTNNIPINDERWSLEDFCPMERIRREELCQDVKEYENMINYLDY